MPIGTNPTGITASWSATTSVTVSWTAPGDLTSITQYRVELIAQFGYGADVSVNTGSLATTRVVTGVTNGVYLVRVAAATGAPAYSFSTGDTTCYNPIAVTVGPRWQEQWNVKVYAFGLEPLTKPSATALVIGHSTRGQIGTTNVVTDTSDPWAYATDLTCYVTDIRIRQGKTQALESFGPSQCTMQFEAVDDRFDPRSTTGAYCVSSRQQFRRGVPMVVCVEGAGQAVSTSTRRMLWSGWLARASLEQAEFGNLRTHQVETFDVFDRLAGYDRNALDSVVGGGDYLDQRVARWLRAVGASTLDETYLASNAAWQLVDGRYGIEYGAMTSTLQSTDMSENALSGVKAAAASSVNGASQNVVWPNAKGRVTIGSIGYSPPLSIPTYTFTDDPLGHIALGSPNLVAIAKRSVQHIDEAAFKNVANFARKGGSSRVAVGASVDEILAIQIRTDLQCADDATVQTIADTFVALYGQDWGAGGPTTWTHTLNPAIEQSAFAFATTCTVGITDTNVGQVLGWEHSIQPDLRWMTTVTTSEVP